MEPRDDMAEQLLRCLLMQYSRSPLRVDMRTNEAVSFQQWLGEMAEAAGLNIKQYELGAIRDAGLFRVAAERKGHPEIEMNHENT